MRSSMSTPAQRMQLSSIRGNRALSPAMAAAALAGAAAGDTLLLQNETTAQAEAAALAASKGLRVIYSAAPFDISAVRAVLSHVSLLVMNEIEAEQLRAELGRSAGL